MRARIIINRQYFLVYFNDILLCFYMIYIDVKGYIVVINQEIVIG